MPVSNERKRRCPFTFASLYIEIPRIFARSCRWRAKKGAGSSFRRVRARRDHVGPRRVSAGNRPGNNSRNFPRAPKLTSRHGRGSMQGGFQSLKVEQRVSPRLGSPRDWLHVQHQANQAGLFGSPYTGEQPPQCQVLLVAGCAGTVRSHWKGRLSET